MRHPIKNFTRESFERQNMTARSASFSATANEETGTVEAVIATEQPVQVFDFETFRTIDEVLVGSGGTFPDQIPLLDSHNRGRAADVLGSATNFTFTGGMWKGTANFDLGDPEAARVFHKVQKRFITDVSIGYKPEKFVDIQPGKSRNVGGRSYTAGERVLRVTTKWTTRELSVTPIGADSLAKFRGSADFSQEKNKMNARLIKYLQRLGMPTDATEEQAREFMAGLSGFQRSISGLLDYAETDDSSRSSADVAIGALGFDIEEPWNHRSQDPPADPDAGSNVAVVQVIDHTAVAQEAIRAERERVTEIRGLADGITPDVLQSALDDGITVDEANTRFLADLRTSRGSGQGQDRTPDVESESRIGRLMVRSMVAFGQAPSAMATSRDMQRNAISLSMALMAREMTEDDVIENFAVLDGNRIQSFGKSHREELEHNMEHAHGFRDMSLVDVAGECLRMNGVQGRWSAQSVLGELQRSTVSTATFSGILTTNFSAQLIAGYGNATDTTGPWTTEADVPDYRLTERPRVLQGDPLTRHARGGTAEHVTFSDQTENYKAAKYTGQFVVDEMDMIDDRFGALDQLAPNDMGIAARQIRPDLVYSILLANDDMGDGVALFHADHNNLETSQAFTAATAKEAITAMNTQTENGRLLDKAGPLTFLMPEALSFAAEQVLNSTVISNDSGVGDRNSLASRATTIISDGRLDNGVTDPRDGTAHAGAADDWFVIRSSGRHTIEVGFVRGTGRAPTVRSFVLDRGQWGIGWDVALSIGAKALDWLGLQKNEG